MRVGSFLAGKSAGFAGAALLGIVAGCQAGDTLGGLGGGRATPPPAQVTQAELLGYCPSVAVRQADAILDSYQRGGQDDPSRLIYRATLNDATRSCAYRDGQTHMTIAIAGRVVPGKASTVGNMRMPIRISVYEDTQQIYSQLHNYDVAIGDTIGATQFVFSDSSFSMPNPTRRNIRVIVGYEKAGG